ncbi:hypothetical protein A2961_01605 [Candidatus Woesebacteria bacterium RIFCSPLOWO2_01_FULL_39_21]|uniref:Glycosyltransferase 2-like domain-containing protein n=1 Tax=Candidatus Woesebacteria bacterium RIFCSPLOWO2_01_FULL_39_21 TaxID=1802519 RepID=A0A1F8BMK0_9BACT|nr:MAG: hypothetical protein A2691_00905 [Candidatus Woesebacteria bacterium RIFCSPHIGHO2_01_FULL_39_23]OGM65287.1 MAG: hypothetical protein A2961_01605 [Candidatus Woesebacteria bacterium RIFCSPLOWO2_01_FULL_39_21]
MKITVVIAAFNEEKRLGAILGDLKAEKAIKEVIVVDDGSKDETSKVSKRYKARLIRVKNNTGKGNAMKLGATMAFDSGANAVIFMDGDGQHKTRDLHYFVDALTIGGFDVVFGSRNLSLGVPLFRYLGNKFASVLINLLFGIYVSDLICGFRAINKRGFNKLNWESKGYGVETEMVILTGIRKLKHCEVPVEVAYYDSFKGVTFFDALVILKDVLKWKLFGWKNFARNHIKP